MGFSPGDLSRQSLALLAASVNIKAYVLRTVRNNDANPINNVAPSSFTETPCKRSNSTRSGLPTGVAATDPISRRNSIIRRITTCCEITVSTTIIATPIVGNSTDLLEPLAETASAADANRNTIPAATPSVCNRRKVNSTSTPARSWLGRTRNAPGATAALK